MDLSIDNLKIGRYALYEILLKYKKIDLLFSEHEWKSYLIALKNTLSSFLACHNILQEEQPDRIVTYNSLYSVNRVWLELAKLEGIPTYFLHAGVNLSDRLETICVGQNNPFSFCDELKIQWKLYQNQPCSQRLLKKVTNHFLSLFAGQHFLAYSPPATGILTDIRSFFGIQEDQKILVATMSSYDEIFAAETTEIMSDSYNLIFPQQIDWIKALIDFVTERPDLFLIIRLHPREFPNRRDSQKSQHSTVIQELLQTLPKNIKANYPIDNISLYDLAEHTDLFLNAWSTAGEEMSFLGIPVVIYSQDLVLYPPDLHYVASSKTDFFSKIDEALVDGWSFERMRMGFRWHVLKLERCVFNISESFAYNESIIQNKNKQIQSLSSISRKVYAKIRANFSSTYREKLKYHQQINDCQNRAKFLKMSNQINTLITENKNTILDLSQDENEFISNDQELIYIKEEIMRLIEMLYKNYPLLVQPNTLREKLLALIKE